MASVSSAVGEMTMADAVSVGAQVAPSSASVLAAALNKLDTKAAEYVLALPKVTESLEAMRKAMDNITLDKIREAVIQLHKHECLVHDVDQHVVKGYGMLGKIVDTADVWLEKVAGCKPISAVMGYFSGPPPVASTAPTCPDPQAIQDIKEGFSKLKEAMLGLEKKTADAASKLDALEKSRVDLAGVIAVVTAAVMLGLAIKQTQATDKILEQSIADWRQLLSQLQTWRATFEEDKKSCPVGLEDLILLLKDIKDNSPDSLQASLVRYHNIYTTYALRLSQRQVELCGIQSCIAEKRGYVKGRKMLHDAGALASGANAVISVGTMICLTGFQPLIGFAFILHACAVGLHGWGSWKSKQVIKQWDALQAAAQCDAAAIQLVIQECEAIRTMLLAKQKVPDELSIAEELAQLKLRNRLDKAKAAA